MYRLILKSNILLLIIVLGGLLRIYRVLEFPIQLNHDEITQIYDAISVSQTGKDIHGVFLPTIFESIHDFKSPFYTYATAAAYFIFGDREFIIKIPGIFFGILTVPAIFWFTLKLFKNRTIALLAAFTTAVSPFELFFSRKSFENGAGVFFMLVGFASLFTLAEKKKLRPWIYLGIILLILGMYTYFSHALIIPFLFFIFVLIFNKELNVVFFKKYILPTAVGILMVIPLILIILLNPGSRFRSQTVFVSQDVKLGQQLKYAEVDNAIFSSVLKYKTNLDFITDRYLNQFDPSYLFLNGLDFTNQGLLGMGPLFLFQAPFLFLGLIFLIKKVDIKKRMFVFSWILLGTIPSGLTFEPYSPHRIIMVFTMLNIISSVGCYWFTQSLYQLKRVKLVLKTSAILVLISLFILNFVYFIHMYFVNLPFEKSQQIHYPFKQVAQFIWSEYNNFDLIILDPLYGQFAPVMGVATHYYLAYYGKYPPAKFQQEYRIGEKERENIFDKFSVRKVDWREDRMLKNTLIIASPWTLPADSINKENVIKTFYFYDGQPAFYAIRL